MLRGSKIKLGHISSEHLDNCTLDEKINSEFNKIGIETHKISIDKEKYLKYLEETTYPFSYYGGGQDSKQNFIEKTLEHYVSLRFLDLKKESIFIDIAACSSPFYQIIKKRFGLERSYQQDLIFNKGLNDNKIGGYASEIPLPDHSVDAVTLHCSLEHFEGNSDVEFFLEMQRILKTGGKIIVLPFYVAYEYTIHIDPAFNLIKLHKPQIDKGATLRYSDWFQYFSRHYDVKTLQNRILTKTPQLKLDVFFVDNFRDIHPSSYLRFIAVFTKISNSVMGDSI